jgi:hypothetical protein
LAQKYKNTKISHTSTAQLEEERKNNFVDKGKFNHIKEKKNKMFRLNRGWTMTDDDADDDDDVDQQR